MHHPDEPSIALARSAAAQGDVDAMVELASALLVGSKVPRDLPQARRLFGAAADLGHANAALTQVALTANGSGAPPDWPGAMALLRHAAARHGGEAQDQLDLLAAMNLDTDGFPRALPQPVLLNKAPLVRQWRGFLTPAECAHIAMAVQDILAPSQVVDPGTGLLIDHPVRTSAAAAIGPTRESLPIQAILRRIAAATQSDWRQGESLTVLHYAPGQEYRAHVDSLPGSGNQRTMTMLLFLNEGYAGGETRFHAAGLEVAARGGDALCWANVLPDGSPDPASRHAGLPVRQGAKWAATRWIRALPFDVWDGPEPST
jgi:prolyl 4-hydroxylase